ncbi:MAG: flagellar hook-basal body complex protein [Chloroflexi bacterium]|nr:MAG: flagellar hook-basal body complex protein [Chloroflexota bacterium]MBL1194825.1 flagellar hook-basal body complex protein [Chloroflexota bacterium]NOH12116.1 flagellar hook-basal body complex protein [Chloroflexota bacterium]
MSNINEILHISQSSMLARSMMLDIVSHNLANSQTIGFKGSRANFQELLDETRQNGVLLRATQVMPEQGALQITNNPHDLAINGEGYFEVTLPDGSSAYTRDGSFNLDANLKIVTADGYPLVWGGTIPATAEAMQFNADGNVMVMQGGVWSSAGTINLSTFDNPSGLTGYGQNLWLESETSGTAQNGQPATAGFGELVGGALEQSNVNLAEEMSRMLALQRGFELSLRSFENTNQMLSLAISMRR